MRPNSRPWNWAFSKVSAPWTGRQAPGVSHPWNNLAQVSSPTPSSISYVLKRRVPQVESPVCPLAPATHDRLPILRCPLRRVHRALHTHRARPQTKLPNAIPPICRRCCPTSARSLFPLGSTDPPKMWTLSGLPWCLDFGSALNLCLYRTVEMQDKVATLALRRTGRRDIPNIFGDVSPQSHGRERGWM